MALSTRLIVSSSIVNHGAVWGSANHARGVHTRTHPVHALLTIDERPLAWSILSIEKLSTFHHLIRVAAYVLRAVKLFQHTSIELSHDSLTLNPIELHELQAAEAERLWIISVQTMHFVKWYPKLPKLAEKVGFIFLWRGSLKMRWMTQPCRSTL